MMISNQSHRRSFKRYPPARAKPLLPWWLGATNNYYIFNHTDLSTSRNEHLSLLICFFDTHSERRFSFFSPRISRCILILTLRINCGQNPPYSQDGLDQSLDRAIVYRAMYSTYFFSCEWYESCYKDRWDVGQAFGMERLLCFTSSRLHFSFSM